jgi:hypothetical protein
MNKAIILEAMKGLPKPDGLKKFGKPDAESSDDEEGGDDDAAKLSALSDFFAKGRKGDTSGADEAFREYMGMCFPSLDHDEG